MGWVRNVIISIVRQELLSQTWRLEKPCWFCSQAIAQRATYCEHCGASQQGEDEQRARLANTDTLEVARVDAALLTTTAVASPIVPAYRPGKLLHTYRAKLRHQKLVGG